MFLLQLLSHVANAVVISKIPFDDVYGYYKVPGTSEPFYIERYIGKNPAEYYHTVRCHVMSPSEMFPDSPGLRPSSSEFLELSEPRLPVSTGKWCRCVLKNVHNGKLFQICEPNVRDGTSRLDSVDPEGRCWLRFSSGNTRGVKRGQCYTEFYALRRGRDLDDISTADVESLSIKTI